VLLKKGSERGKEGQGERNEIKGSGGGPTEARFQRGRGEPEKKMSVKKGPLNLLEIKVILKNQLTAGRVERSSKKKGCSMSKRGD